MQIGKRQILTIISVIILLNSTDVYAGTADDVKAVKISGGGGHTLVIVEENNAVFGCGPNGNPEGEKSYYSVLGTGNDSQGLGDKSIMC